VVLLDFGQCKALTAQEQRALCVLYGGLAAKDVRTALLAVHMCGLKFGPPPAHAHTPARQNHDGDHDSAGSDADTSSASQLDTMPSGSLSPGLASSASGRRGQLRQRRASPLQHDDGDDDEEEDGGAPMEEEEEEDEVDHGDADCLDVLESSARGMWASAGAGGGSSGWVTRLLAGSWLGGWYLRRRMALQAGSSAAARRLQRRLAGVDAQAAGRMLLIMFDTRWVGA
jgi:hypothetical protein